MKHTNTGGGVGWGLASSAFSRNPPDSILTRALGLTFRLTATRYRLYPLKVIFISQIDTYFYAFIFVSR